MKCSVSCTLFLACKTEGTPRACEQSGKLSVCFFLCHLVSGQAGALYGLLHQSRGLCLFDKLADVRESRGLTLRHHHAEEVGPVVVLQHPRAGKLWRIRQEYSA